MRKYYKTAELPYEWREGFDTQYNQPYYYNLVTQQRQWQKPDFAQMGKRAVPRVAVIAASEFCGEWGRAILSNGKAYYFNELTGESQWKPPVFADGNMNSGLVDSYETSEEEEEPVPKKAKTDIEEDDVDALLDTEKGRRFFALLKEARIRPFSMWDKEMPRLLTDSRFTDIDSLIARKALFDRYVKTQAVVEEKEEKMALKQKVDAFRELFEVFKKEIDRNTPFERFAALAGSDPRFSVLARKEDKEDLFLQYKQNLHRDFEQKKNDASFAFKKLLRETFPFDVVSESWRRLSPHWKDAKMLLQMDPRYREIPFAVLSDDWRRELFYDFVRDTKKHISPEEKKAVDPVMERGQKLAEMRLEAATAAATAALAERVRSVELKFADVDRMLANDSRWTNSALSAELKEELYTRHKNEMSEKYVKNFICVLQEKEALGQLTLGMSWADFVARFGSTDRRVVQAQTSFDAQSQYDRFVESMRHKAVKELKNLVRENHLIERGIKYGTPEYQTAKRVMSLDKRYMYLDAMPDFREGIISQMLQTGYKH